MSKEYVRQLVSRQFAAFSGLPNEDKAYPNYAEGAIPEKGKMWARLSIDFVTAEVASIGSSPNVRRTGTISIKVRAHLNTGSSGITILTDALEEYFQFFTNGVFMTDAANTVTSDNNNAFYEAIVYIPFTYDPSK